MPRTKKVVAKTSSEQSQEPSVEQLFSVLQYAQNIYQGIYTPDLVNSRLKEITMSPIAATAEGIDSALANPKENEQNLIGYTEFMELNSMLFKRVILYFSGLMSFDLNYVCTNVNDPEEYKKQGFKKDLAIVRDFFDKFNHKQEFRTVLKQLLRQEAYYGILRDDDSERFVLQELNQQYCRVVGRYPYGLLFDMNLYWFRLPGVSIDMYPKVFKRMYNKVFENTDTTNYNPAATIDSRTGSWVYWAQTSPEEGFTCFKLFPEIGSIVPLMAPLLPDAVLQSTIRNLQKNSYIQAATKLLFGQIEFLKDTKASVKDQLSLSPETAGKFLALLKSGINDAIKIGAAPLANVAPIDFDGKTDIYDSYLKTTASSSGVNSRLIYSYDRQNILETKASLDIDANVLRPVYSQFENMLAFWVNKRTKKYKFKFILEGFETSIDRDSRLEKATKLADSGIVIDQKFSSALGISPFDFRRMLEETKANDFVKNLTPILKANQMPGNAAGRPSMGDDKLGESGAQTRGDGSDSEKNEGG